MTATMKVGGPNWMQEHLERYLKTDGREGHFADFTPAGGGPEVPCLILKTKGRKSGKPSLLPLIYGHDGANYVIVASKGGAPNHPVWFLNLEADPAVEFQVLDKKFKGRARVTAGAERERLFALMDKIYPPYTAYQAKTDRQIPVVVLEPKSEIARL